jgi:hypothetical protein
MKYHDQRLLEEAYERIVSEANDAAYKKFVQDAKKVNPTWDPKRPLTSGVGFQGLPEPEGGWPDREDKKKDSKQKPKAAQKPKEKREEYDLDVRGIQWVLTDHWLLRIQNQKQK